MKALKIIVGCLVTLSPFIAMAYYAWDHGAFRYALAGFGTALAFSAVVVLGVAVVAKGFED